MKVFNSPRCIAIENGKCNKKAKFVFQYKIAGVMINDTYCQFHAHKMLKLLKGRLGLEVKVFKFEGTKEKVQFT